jgi:hypothetical protein
MSGFLLSVVTPCRVSTRSYGVVTVRIRENKKEREIFLFPPVILRVMGQKFVFCVGLVKSRINNMAKAHRVKAA